MYKPAIPNGMLSKKTERHPKAAIKKPPTTGPAATATPPTAPQIPNARARSDELTNIRCKSDSDVATSSADPIPCKALAITKNPNEGAIPHKAEAIEKSNSPKQNTFLGPIRSPKSPALRSKAANGKI